MHQAWRELAGLVVVVAEEQNNRRDGHPSHLWRAFILSPLLLVQA